MMKANPKVIILFFYTKDNLVPVFSYICNDAKIINKGNEHTQFRHE
jgi:hypothetical protein